MERYVETIEEKKKKGNYQLSKIIVLETKWIWKWFSDFNFEFSW